VSRDVANTLYHLAIIAFKCGETERAEVLVTESSRMLRSIGQESLVAHNLQLLASLALEKGLVDDARDLLNEAINISERCSDQVNIANCRNMLTYLDKHGPVKLIEELRRASEWKRGDGHANQPARNHGTD
jgi:hypothetical protein